MDGRLAGLVGPADDGEPSRRLDLELRVALEVGQGGCGSGASSGQRHVIGVVEEEAPAEAQHLTSLLGGGDVTAGLGLAEPRTDIER